jgi:DNA helicase HerA-like ATPase
LGVLALKILRKEGENIQLLCFPEEEVEKGDYLLITDKVKERSLIIQIIDIQYANIPGILEDLLRDGISEGSLTGDEVDPFKVSSQITILKDTRLLLGKIRGAIEDGRMSRDVSWLPSRNHSQVEVMPPKLLTQALTSKHAFELGSIPRFTHLSSDLSALDGRLNIVTGRKGTGKSHLTKLLVTSLVQEGAPVVVLDVNGEYVNLGQTPDGRQMHLSPRIISLIPGLNLRFNLSQVGLGTLLGTLTYALALPENSARVFARIWHELEDQNQLTMSSLGAAIANFDCHESIKDALQARFNTLDDSGIFTDDPRTSLNLEEVFRNHANGCALIVNMKNQYAALRRMVVELLISKLTDLLSTQRLRALFLFAEEAHLYLRDTYWEDAVTRMRHLGLFTTFVTNQPDTIQSSIYRQADNIFLFNFSNEHDLDIVSKVAKVDGDTIRMIVRDLPPRRCLIIGDVVANFPLVVNIRPLEVQTLGATRYYFEQQFALA